MKHRFLSYLFLPLGITSCCKKTPPLSSQIIKKVDKNITQIEKTIDYAKNSLPSGCKDINTINTLENIKLSVNGIKNDLESIEISCKMEKKDLMKDNKILKLYIFILVLIIIGYIGLKLWLKNFLIPKI